LFLLFSYLRSRYACGLTLRQQRLLGGRSLAISTPKSHNKNPAEDEYGLSQVDHPLKPQLQKKMLLSYRKIHYVPLNRQFIRFTGVMRQETCSPRQAHFIQPGISEILFAKSWLCKMPAPARGFRIGVKVKITIKQIWEII